MRLQQRERLRLQQVLGQRQELERVLGQRQEAQQQQAQLVVGWQVQGLEQPVVEWALVLPPEPWLSQSRGRPRPGFRTLLCASGSGFVSLLDGVVLD